MLASAFVAQACPAAGQARGTVTRPAGVLPVERVINEIKCDYLDFAYSDQARAARLGVGRLTGSITLSLARGGARGEILGVPLAHRAIRLDDPVSGRDMQAPVNNALTIPFAFDPQLALNPAGAGLNCGAGARLAHPILSVTALATSLAAAGSDGANAAIGRELRYQGQFYLLLLANGQVDVVPLRVDPARVGADAILLQSFDARVETGVPSWFADVGPGTAEPLTAANARAARVPLAAAGRTTRVRQVPRAPTTSASASRCVTDPSGETICY